MRSSTLRSAAVALLFIVLTIAMTWPQAASMGTRVYDADDPLLSIWRISWIAHIVPIDPLNLFNGNIFYPEKRTLAYTDSVLLQGAAGAPLIWSGVSRVTTYNVLLLLSMALSGWAMWRYALYLTADHGAAILAGIIFAFVPFRFDHYHHLELQATIFLPLTLMLLDRAIDSGSKRDAWLTMAAFVAQLYSCIYYSVFLATALIPIGAIRLALATREQRMAFAKAMWLPLLAALIAAAPYAIAYGANRINLGERLDRDVMLYSASLRNYIATPEWNVVHGGPAHDRQAPRDLDRARRHRLHHFARLALAVLRAVARGDLSVSRTARAGARIDPAVSRHRGPGGIRLEPLDARSPATRASGRDHRDGPFPVARVSQP